MLVDDPDTVASVYQDIIAELDVSRAQRRHGIRINVDRPPSHGELRAAVERTGLSIVRIQPGTGSPE